MKRRAFYVLMAAAVGSLALYLSAAQRPASTGFNPARLADGSPDIQGLWISDAVGAAHSVEDGRDPDTDVIQGRVGEENPPVMMEPADGRIPYQPALAARRTQL